MYVIEIEVGKNTLKYSDILLKISINSVITEKNYIITCSPLAARPGNGEMSRCVVSVAQLWRTTQWSSQLRSYSFRHYVHEMDNISPHT